MSDSKPKVKELIYQYELRVNKIADDSMCQSRNKSEVGDFKKYKRWISWDMTKRSAVLVPRQTSLDDETNYDIDNNCQPNDLDIKSSQGNSGPNQNIMQDCASNVLINYAKDGVTNSKSEENNCSDVKSSDTTSITDCDSSKEENISVSDYQASNVDNLVQNIPVIIEYPEEEIKSLGEPIYENVRGSRRARLTSCSLEAKRQEAQNVMLKYRKTVDDDIKSCDDYSSDYEHIILSNNDTTDCAKSYNRDTRSLLDDFNIVWNSRYSEESNLGDQSIHLAPNSKHSSTESNKYSLVPYDSNKLTLTGDKRLSLQEEAYLALKRKYSSADVEEYSVNNSVENYDFAKETMKYSEKLYITPKASTEESYFEQTSTVYDINLNPRMSTVSKIPVYENATIVNQSSPKTKKEYIIEELINTEISYIATLDYVISEYMSQITDENVYGSMVGKCSYIFLNLCTICDGAKKFLANLKLNHSEPNLIGKTFLKHKDLFNQYPIYIKNKKYSFELLQTEFKEIVSNLEAKLNDQLKLESHLLKPIQRLGKYELLLTSLEKQLKKEGKTSSVSKAIRLIQYVTRKGEDLLVLDTIIDNPYSINDTGNFMFKETFKLLPKLKKIDVVMFLFENMIIFAYPNPKNIETLIYKNYISMTSLTLVDHETDLTFTLQDYHSKKRAASQHTFLLEARNVSIKDQWVTRLKMMLWKQLQLVKKKADEQNQYEGKKTELVELKKEEKVEKNKINETTKKGSNKVQRQNSIFYTREDF